MAHDDFGFIPDKLYFKIGEVCDIVGVKQYVLRYWETEFSIIRPQRAASQQRLYRRVDVENILRIKKLLKEEGFTISGARKLLAREKADQHHAGKMSAKGRKLLQDIKGELAEIKEMLEKG